MDKTLQEIGDILLKLDDQVLKIELAHSDMVESLFDALTIAKEINAKVSRKWFLAVQSHKRLGKEIRQLLLDLNEIKHRVNMSVQPDVPPES